MSRFAPHCVKLCAAVVPLCAIFWAARLPTIPPHERQELAARFDFDWQPLPEVDGPERRYVRPVHPSLEHVAAWISSVGASVALADLDGDEIPNDVCYVDTRTDQVILAPTPGTGERFAPFALQPGSSLYDRATMAPTHCLPGDLNEDGLMDVVVSYWGRLPIAFLRRAGASDSLADLNAASFVPVDIVPGGERWFTDAACRADVDGDGHVDLIIGNYFQDGSRILDATAGGTEYMQASMSMAFNGGRNRLLLWAGGSGGENPTVQFRDASFAIDAVGGVPVGMQWTLAIGAADLDGDLLPELYFGNDFGPDQLLHNRSKPGKPRFGLLSGERMMTIPKSKVLGHDSFKGMGVDFADLNGDGLLDMFVSNIAAEYALEESHFVWVSTGRPEDMKRGIAPYTDESERLGMSRSGWGWDSRFADFDNDGVLEAVQALGFILGDTNRWPELDEVGMGNDQWLAGTRHWHSFLPGDDLSDRNNSQSALRPCGGWAILRRRARAGHGRATGLARHRAGRRGPRRRPRLRHGQSMAAVAVLPQRLPAARRVSRIAPAAGDSARAASQGVPAPGHSCHRRRGDCDLAERPTARRPGRWRQWPLRRPRPGAPFWPR